MRLIKFITIYQSSWNSLMNFHELSYKLNWSYQIQKESWLFMKLSIWTSWTNSWTTLVHQVFINIHDLSWTVLMNSSWTQFMNWLDEPLMNVHECSWTFINVHHLINFISPGSSQNFNSSLWTCSHIMDISGRKIQMMIFDDFWPHRVALTFLFDIW